MIHRLKSRYKEKKQSISRRIHKRTISPPVQITIDTQAQESPTSLTNNFVYITNSSSTQPLAVTPNSSSQVVVAQPAAESDAVATETINQSVEWPSLRTLLGLLAESTDSFGPLRCAVGDVSRCIEILENQGYVREGYSERAKQLDGLFGELKEYLDLLGSTAMTASIAKAARDIEQATELISCKEQQSDIVHLPQVTEDKGELGELYRTIQNILSRLSLGRSVNRLREVPEQTITQSLDCLPNSPNAFYRSAKSDTLFRHPCTQDTRVNVLRQLREWAGSNKHTVCWITGMAGTGKTTIAYSACCELEDMGKLGASFFCSRQLPECRDVNRIVPSIAYQLALYSRHYRVKLAKVLQKMPEAYNHSLSDQLEHLIAHPLRSIGQQFPADVIIVIDALEECEDMSGVERLLEVIACQTHVLPIRFLVTSRPEPVIVNHMQDPVYRVTRKVIGLHGIARRVIEQDIHTYLATELRPAKLTHKELAMLVQRSGTLFLYAATIVRYLGYRNFEWCQTRLQRVLGIYGASAAQSEEDLYELFETILEAACEEAGPETEQTDQTRMALHMILCVREPLSLDTITRLLDLEDKTTVEMSLQPLLSMLHISNGLEIVTILHQSFPSYLLDDSRLGNLHCDEGEQNAVMVYACFNIIDRVNVPSDNCRLQSLFKLGEGAVDPETEIQSRIDDSLSYACRYWAYHLQSATQSERLVREAEKFLQTKLLLWMEVMNLEKRSRDANKALVAVLRWIERIGGQSGVKELLQDAVNFLTRHYIEGVPRNTPHICVSVPAYWPKDTLLVRTHEKRMKGLTKMAGTTLKQQGYGRPGQMTTCSRINGIACAPNDAHIATGGQDGVIYIWDACTGQRTGQRLIGHTMRLNCVAYSSDGVHIVSGSDDSTVRIWNVHTTEQVGSPLTGHARWVGAVAYSPGGAHVVSGSHDCTVRIWDAHTGKQTGEPLTGHTGYVKSVAYSPDGAHVVSGSCDRTVRIWDTYTGKQTGQPLIGHTGYIKSVAYSPDGAYVVSGSCDHTICIWDVQAREQVGWPLTGHTDYVESVAYSPDGAHIVSGSRDLTVRIWNAHTGQQVLQPSIGHTDYVKSVAYSLDGAYVVSGSRDHTVRIWDAHTGKQTGEPLTGHASWVNTVSYSPGGMYVASGSHDTTVCIWDAHTKKQAGRLLLGHTSTVRSVAYSPDGAHLVSGSDDRTVRIWDAHTRQQISQPLAGHSSSVNCVAYSPDCVHVVSGSNDCTVRIWDARTRKHASPRLTGHTSFVRSVAYSPDGTRIVSGSNDRTVRIWDAYTGKQVGRPLIGHGHWVNCVVYSPDGAHIVSGSDDSTVRMWNAHTGEEVGRLRTGYASSVHCVAYSPNGAHVVSGSYDGTIRIWDIYSRDQASQLTGHTGPVKSVAYSPDGTRVVSGSHDSTVRIWNAQTGEQVD